MTVLTITALSNTSTAHNKFVIAAWHVQPHSQSHVVAVARLALVDHPQQQLGRDAPLSHSLRSMVGDDDGSVETRTVHLGKCAKKAADVTQW